MLKNLFSNPVTRTFITMTIALVAVLGAFFTFVTAPETFGSAGIKFDVDKVWYFADSWSVAYDYAKISFSPGTLVIPSYHQGRVIAVLLIPPEEHPGTISMSFPSEYRGELPETIEDSLEQTLILLDYTDYTRILQDSGNTILLRADEIPAADVPQQYLKLQLEQGCSLLTSYDIFGFTNRLLPTAQTVLLRLWGRENGAFTYYEDAQVELTAPDFSLSFTHPELEKQFYPPAGYQVRVLIYMAFLAIAAISLISFIAGGQESPGTEVEGQYNFYRTLAVLLVTLLYAGALSAFDKAFRPSAYITAALWALPLLPVAYWSLRTRLKPSFFGVTSRGLASGLIAALAVCALITLGSTFSLPVGLVFDFSVFLPLGLSLVFREAVLRGFCQRVTSHWLHPLAGFFLISFAWALIAVYTGPGPAELLTLVSALGKSLLIGYIYHCTNNLFAPCLLAVLLEGAPLFLVF